MPLTGEFSNKKHFFRNLLAYQRTYVCPIGILGTYRKICGSLNSICKLYNKAYFYRYH